MRKIAVFTSGDAAGAERLISLFNEGNRIRIEVVVTDGDPAVLEERFRPYGVEVIGVSPESMPDEIVAIGDSLSSKGIELYAIDSYEGLMTDWIRRRHPSKVKVLSSPEDAPREVVAALAAIDKGEEEDRLEKLPPAPKTVDEEWAEVLQIDFDSQRAKEAAERVAGANTPPPVPEQPPVVPPHAGSPAPQPPVFANNPQYGQNITGGPQPQYGNRPVNGDPMPPTYLVWSVIMTILCCFIPGIVAIIFSSQVSSKYFAGDIEGAYRASRNAEIWIIVSFVLGVLSATLYMPIMLVSGS